MEEIKNQEEANKVIAEKLEEIHKLLKECEKIADEHHCYFKLDVVYGVGATYRPKPIPDPAGEWNESSSEEYGWQASSQFC